MTNWFARRWSSRRCKRIFCDNWQGTPPTGRHGGTGAGTIVLRTGATGKSVDQLAMDQGWSVLRHRCDAHGGVGVEFFCSLECQALVLLDAIHAVSQHRGEPTMNNMVLAPFGLLRAMHAFAAGQHTEVHQLQEEIDQLRSSLAEERLIHDTLLRQRDEAIEYAAGVQRDARLART